MPALATRAHDETATVVPAGHLQPFRGACPACGADVLAVELVHGAGEAVLEVAEIMERFACPACAQVHARGHQRSDCIRCGLTGWLGEDLPIVGVAVDVDGAGRLFTGQRGSHEAVHRLHLCPDAAR